jgi:hypothetical protein
MSVKAVGRTPPSPCLSECHPYSSATTGESARTPWLLGHTPRQPASTRWSASTRLAGMRSARRGGDRIIYEIDDTDRLVVVHRIEHRATVYRRRCSTPARYSRCSTLSLAPHLRRTRSGRLRRGAARNATTHGHRPRIAGRDHLVSRLGRDAARSENRWPVHRLR